MEVISLALCINFCIIYPLLILVSYDILCSSHTRRGGQIPYTYLLYSLLNDLTFPTANSLPLTFHVPLHSMCDTIGRDKATIRFSCSYDPQNGMPTVMVNNKSDSFPICILHNNSIKRGTTTMYVLYGLLRRAYENKSMAVSIDAGKGVYNILSTICSS